MIYEGCPESIQPFWISLEPVGWPWYNLAASQRPYWDVRVQSLSRGASQSAVRQRWLSVCTVWPSYSQITFLSTTILALGKARSRMKTNLDCRGVLTDLVDVILCQKKSLHESCTMGRRIVVLKLICSPGHCECDGHTVHKLGQRRLTADWTRPRENEFHGCTVRSALTGCHATGSRDIQKGLILSGQTS